MGERKRFRIRPRAPTLESLFVATFGLLGVRLGTLPIFDNSALVHLRTGVDMVARGAIPRLDPYSFTAAGEPWVVQSWLAAGAYGVLERLGGAAWVVVLNGVLMGALAWTMVRLARTGRPLTTLLAGSIVVAVAADSWSPRPLIFGLLALAVTVTIVDRGLRPWLLVPVVWVWVNSHGSFPLGLLWILAVAAGGGLDARSWRAARPTLRYAGWFVVGLAAAAVNPLGPRLLTFAVTVGEKREAFASVREWHSPDFQEAGGLLVLVGIVAALAVIAHRRPRWSDLVPVLVFLGLALLARRSLPVFAVVLAPALGRALAPPAPSGPPGGPPPGPRAGSDGDSEPVAASGTNAVFAAVLAAAALLFLASAATGPGLDLEPYPTSAVRRLEQAGRFERPHRVATQDFVGCLLILRHGRDARVFIDDRVDMYPAAVSAAYRSLLNGGPRALPVLDRYRVDTVVWERGEALATILRTSRNWRQVDRDGDFLVFYRR